MYFNHITETWLSSFDTGQMFSFHHSFFPCDPLFFYIISVCYHILSHLPHISEYICNEFLSSHYINIEFGLTYLRDSILLKSIWCITNVSWELNDHYPSGYNLITSKDRPIIQLKF